MVTALNYWSKVLKRIFNFALTLLLLFLLLKLSVFYLPFLIAFVLALLIEPIIKAIMKNFKWTRRTSSIFVIAISMLLLFLIAVWGTSTLFKEADKLLSGSDMYFDKSKDLLNNLTNNEKLLQNLPEEMRNSIENSEDDLIRTFTNWITNTLSQIRNWLTKIPNLLFMFFFALMALYFMCTDKIYMIDQMEHHLPDPWMKKLTKYIKEISKSIGQYLRAEFTLIFISFMICLIGLSVFKVIGLNVQFPFLSALGIAFVDALPILGSSAVMIPWAVVEALNGDIILGVSIIVLLGIMGIVRNVLEPKLVSKHIGIHPVITLIAMYTGYKTIGVFGMILGPILLIILKEIYSPMIEKGVFRSLFDDNV